MSSSWRLGSDEVEVPIPALEIDPGQALVAEVVIHRPWGGTGHMRRVVCCDGEARVVRQPNGRLLWLESPRGHAFRRTASDPSIIEAGPETDVVIPRDAGVEFLAAIDLDNLRDWTGGRLSARLHTGHVRLTSTDWGPLLVELSARGNIREVSTDASPSRTILAATRERFTARRAEWFEPSDVDTQEISWPW